MRRDFSNDGKGYLEVVLRVGSNVEGWQTFKHRAAIIWNSLPEGVKRSPSYNSFKNSLQKQSNLIDNISFGSSSIVSKKDINNYIFF